MTPLDRLAAAAVAYGEAYKGAWWGSCIGESPSLNEMAETRDDVLSAARAYHDSIRKEAT